LLRRFVIFANIGNSIEELSDYERVQTRIFKTQTPNINIIHYVVKYLSMKNVFKLKVGDYQNYITIY